MFVLNTTINLCHLTDIKFACQDNHIGKLRIEAQGLYVGDVELRAEMHLKAYLATIGHHSHIAGNDSTDVCLQSCIEDTAHERQVLSINNGIDCQITLHATASAFGSYAMQVINSEGTSRMCPHIEILYTEIYAVCSRPQGGSQGFK